MGLVSTVKIRFCESMFEDHGFDKTVGAIVTKFSLNVVMS